MSLLNLAIQNVVIAREPSDMIDGKLQSCSTMAEIRKLASTVPFLKKAWGDSLKSVMEVLESRFELVIVRRPTDLQLRETVGIPETRYFFWLA